MKNHDSRRVRRERPEKLEKEALSANQRFFRQLSLMISLKVGIRRQRKKIQMQGAQILRNEAYIEVRCNDEGCSATQHMDFLRSRHP